jgi:hypothetical protein
MERRELLKMIAAATGAAVIGSELFLSGCKNAGSDSSSLKFTAETISILDEIAETILPATSTPGAKAAEVGQFMSVIVNDCYTTEQQLAFHEGINKLNEACSKAKGKSFMKCSAEERTAFLTELDKEAKQFQKEKPELEKKEKVKNKDFIGIPDHYFTMMKQLTIWGFFTSKVGATQALRYSPTPGKYEGCVPYKKGDKAWAT